MISGFALALSLASAPATTAPPKQHWLGSDKVKHFFVSAMVQSVVYSGARAGGLDRRSAQLAGGGAVLVVGVWKEARDRRAARPFSIPDLAWDAAGGLAAASLLNGTR